MSKTVRSSAVVVAALWVGVLFTLGFIVAPYLFGLSARQSEVVPNSGVAAELIGPLLYSSDVLGLIVGTLLLAALLYLRRRNQVPMGGRFFLAEIGVIVAVVGAAINYWVFTPRINQLQTDLAGQYGAFHLADKADPLYRQFNAMHMTSTLIFMLGFVAVLVCLVCMTQFRTRPDSRRAVAA